MAEGSLQVEPEDRRGTMTVLLCDLTDSIQGIEIQIRRLKSNLFYDEPTPEKVEEEGYRMENTVEDQLLFLKGRLNLAIGALDNINNKVMETIKGTKLTNK